MSCTTGCFHTPGYGFDQLLSKWLIFSSTITLAWYWSVLTQVSHESLVNSVFGSQRHALYTWVMQKWISVSFRTFAFYTSLRVILTLLEIGHSKRWEIPNCFFIRSWKAATGLFEILYYIELVKWWPCFMILVLLCM